MKITKRTWKNKNSTGSAWVLTYTDRQGERHRYSFPTRKKAEAERNRVAAELHAGTHAPYAKKTTISDAIDIYIDALGRGARIKTNRRLKEATIEHYTRHLESYARPEIGHLRLAEIDAHEIAQFRDWLTTRSGAGRRAAEITLNVLKYALDEANSRGLVSGRPWQGITISSVKTTTKSSGAREARPSEELDDDDALYDPIPSTEEVRRIIETAWLLARDPKRVRDGDIEPKHDTKGRRGLHMLERAWQRYAPMIELGAITGIRQGELRGLRVKDYRPIERELRIRRSADLKNRITDPKTSAAVRDLPLSPRAVEILEAMCHGRNREEFIFTTRKGSPIYATNFHARAWQTILEHSGIGRYRYHALRHHYASTLIALKADALELKEMLGHASIQTTYDIYGHLLRGDKETRRARMHELSERLSGTQLAQNLHQGDAASTGDAEKSPGHRKIIEYKQGFR